jgi:iron-sulfur cluster assembly protein
MDITVTDNARRKLVEYLGDGENFLRISVVSGGCAGMTYDAAIDSKISETDEVVFEDEAVRIVSDRGNALFIGSLQIDYSDDLIQSGFRLVNPLAGKSCGCGASFSP